MANLVYLITQSSVNIQKQSAQIALYLEIFNFKIFRAEILQMFELLIWKIDDFIKFVLT